MQGTVYLLCVDNYSALPVNEASMEACVFIILDTRARFYIAEAEDRRAFVTSESKTCAGSFLHENVEKQV